MKLGIVKETKTPVDRRVALTPMQCSLVKKLFPWVDIFVQPDPNRSFTDAEYQSEGITMRENLDQCDVLLGIKEVVIEALIPGKKYLFFSHTAKKQIHNKQLLSEIVNRKITLIDYEYLTLSDNTRVVAFGKWAGIVGAYNGLRAWGLRTKRFSLKPAWQCMDKHELFIQLEDMDLSEAKILITGGGRVARGAEEVLVRSGVEKYSPEDYLSEKFKNAVFTQIDPLQYVKRKDNNEVDLGNFFSYPEQFESNFLPYATQTNLLIACHYWDPRSPVFFEREDMTGPEFTIRIIADVSCDVNGSIPSTIRVSTIQNPFYGYDPITGKEAPSFEANVITVMAVDNLPGELPRDSSEDFGSGLINNVFPSLFGKEKSDLINRATITENGKLTPEFGYLKDFLDE